MRGLKLVVAVLASTWFFPLSCTSATAVGTLAASKLDERVVADGDELHKLFRVAKLPGGEERSFAVIDLESAQDSAGAGGSNLYRLPVKSASMEWGQSNYTYTVLANDGREQLIELVETYHDGDNTIHSRYRATASAITPVSSRMFYSGYVFVSLSYAFGFALMLNLLAKMVQRRMSKSRSDEGTANG